jgi:uncharacterized membrane protein YedE/YeeE
MDLISQPWPWYVAGPLIAFTMALLLLFGRRFGVSSNFQTICTMCGAGKIADYFKIDWKTRIWSLVFIVGSIIGGYIAQNYLMGENGEHSSIALSEATQEHFSQDLNWENAGTDYQPAEIFSWDNLFTTQGIIMIILGGFLVGFGTRYANGCTSGHAISGLSNLQLPSLIAVIGFFIGGLIVTWFVLPNLITL